jgi:L-ribulose-5-phosphate 3-epimerase
VRVPKNPLTRRMMLAQAAATAGFLAFSPAFEPLFADAGSRRLRIGACEWSLRKGDASSLEVAKQIGLDGVQVNMGSVGNQMHLRETAVQQAYLEAAKRNGVAISSLAIAEMNNVPLKSDPRAAQWLAESVEIMRALNVKIVLVAAFAKGDLVGDKAGVDYTVEVLKRLAPGAEKAGVIFGLENYLSAEENLDILRRVGSPAVQVYYDVGNSTDKGYNIYREIRMLKGKVCEFHAKDGNFMLGQGRIDFQKVREAMDDIGFSGWIQIEAATPHDLVSDYQKDLKFLRGIFND